MKIGKTEDKTWMRLITFVVITCFLYQNIVWAEGGQSCQMKLSQSKLAPGSPFGDDGEEEGAPAVDSFSGYYLRTPGSRDFGENEDDNVKYVEDLLNKAKKVEDFEDLLKEAVEQVNRIREEKIIDSPYRSTAQKIDASRIEVRQVLIEGYPKLLGIPRYFQKKLGIHLPSNLLYAIGRIEKEGEDGPERLVIYITKAMAKKIKEGFLKELLLEMVDHEWYEHFEWTESDKWARHRSAASRSFLFAAEEGLSPFHVFWFRQMIRDDPNVFYYFQRMLKQYRAPAVDPPVIRYENRFREKLREIAQVPAELQTLTEEFIQGRSTHIFSIERLKWIADKVDKLYNLSFDFEARVILYFGIVLALLIAAIFGGEYGLSIFLLSGILSLLLHVLPRGAGFFGSLLIRLIEDQIKVKTSDPFVLLTKIGLLSFTDGSLMGDGRILIKFERDQIVKFMDPFEKENQKVWQSSMDVRSPRRSFRAFLRIIRFLMDQMQEEYPEHPITTQEVIVKAARAFILVSAESRGLFWKLRKPKDMAKLLWELMKLVDPLDPQLPAHEEESAEEEPETLKAPGAKEFSPRQKKYVKRLLRNAKKAEDLSEVVETAVDRLNSILQERGITGAYRGRSIIGIDPKIIEIREVVPIRKTLLGIPRSKKARLPYELDYAVGEVEGKGEARKLVLNITKALANRLRDGELVDILPELINHEYCHKILKMTHREAASQSWIFAPLEGGQLSPFHEFWFENMVKAGTVALEHFDKILEEDRAPTEDAAVQQYEERFRARVEAVKRLFALAEESVKGLKIAAPKGGKLWIKGFWGRLLEEIHPLKAIMDRLGNTYFLGYIAAAWLLGDSNLSGLLLDILIYIVYSVGVILGGLMYFIPSIFIHTLIGVFRIFKIFFQSIKDEKLPPAPGDVTSVFDFFIKIGLMPEDGGEFCGGGQVLVRVTNGEVTTFLDPYEERNQAAWISSMPGEKPEETFAMFLKILQEMEKLVSSVHSEGAVSTERILLALGKAAVLLSLDPKVFQYLLYVKKEDIPAKLWELIREIDLLRPQLPEHEEEESAAETNEDVSDDVLVDSAV